MPNAVVAMNRARLTSSQQDIASQGGKASSGSFEKGSEAAKEAGRNDYAFKL
jgi:general stress protein YciG